MLFSLQETGKAQVLFKMYEGVMGSPTLSTLKLFYWGQIQFGIFNKKNNKICYEIL